jgi:hypothetical protein
MEKEFVPYELAVKLKSLGFDEKCFCNWEESWSPEPEDEIRMVLTTDQTWLRPGWIRAPTFSQAFKWFREKGFLIDFSSHNKDAHDFYFKWSENKSILSDTYDTYEETELACLEKLIEIVENNLDK